MFFFDEAIYLVFDAAHGNFGGGYRPSGNPDPEMGGGGGGVSGGHKKFYL